MTDDFSSEPVAPSGPARGMFSITKSDSVDFAKVTRGIYVDGGGDLAVVATDGTVVTFVAVPAGAVLPVVAKRVNSAGTTATNMVGMY